MPAQSWEPGPPEKRTHKLSLTVKIAVGLLLAGGVAIFVLRRKQASYTDVGQAPTPSHDTLPLPVVRTGYSPPAQTQAISFAVPTPTSILGYVAPSTGPKFQARRGKGAF